MSIQRKSEATPLKSDSSVLAVLHHEDKVHDEGPAELPEEAEVGDDPPDLETVDDGVPVKVDGARLDHPDGREDRGGDASREPPARHLGQRHVPRLRGVGAPAAARGPMTSDRHCARLKL
eukprot:CAMPEP_0180360904 /NCGR_PEP_ID=MMETSP0989-20121125/12268_1 /TAXON_ID=697907 /ORGANISM="non described non described, Strain CCMP2293" /LENGTH=119 /DNA_ID=CAMNT_0022352359 /DNA_START=746 /DNA_END=1101 /DNA_ORIENTATION=-